MLSGRFILYGKYFIRYITYLIILLGILISVSAYENCTMPGYGDYCIIYQNDFLYTKIALRLTDITGDVYQDFLYSGFAVGGFYADVYFQGDELYYMYNLTNMTDVCDYDGCRGGQLMNDSGFYQLAALGEEYVGCPAFASLSRTAFDSDYYVWAAFGWLFSGGCVHIRVVNCSKDLDCGIGYYCSKPDIYDWRLWSCQPSYFVKSSSTDKLDESLLLKSGSTSKLATYLAGSYASYVASYQKSDFKAISLDLIFTPLAALVYYVDLIVLGGVCSVCVVLVSKIIKK